MNAFLRMAMDDPAIRRQLRTSDAGAAAALAQGCGFDVTVGDLIRYQARATTWQLSDAELAVVAQWQSAAQPFWWRYLGPDE